MSQLLDAHAKEYGTKFLVYPQNKTVPGFENPEVLYINSPPKLIQAGPEDERMYVVDALNKKQFDHPDSPPFSYPYNGPHLPAVQPNAEGHFDHVRPGSREFSAAAMYATVRRVMDIWEDYFGREIPWSFDYPKLLLIPRVEWDNAQSGPAGFLEFGFPLNENETDFDRENPYCENFDVLAHEIGHTIKNSVIGRPQIQMTNEYRGHHEAFGDLIAIVSTLHFDSVINRLLQNTKGNLFSVNELARIGELRDGRSIRIAFNNKKMSDVSQRPHDLSKPFTGGAFDILVMIFQMILIEVNLIPKELGDRAYEAHFNEIPELQEEFAKHYINKELEFKSALLDARDRFGKLMAHAWNNTSKENLHYGKVLQKILDADKELFEGKYEQAIHSCFEWREITPSTSLEFGQLERHVVDELND
ncbi:hypothetical protein MOE39_05015 [Bacillus cereus]|uniref:hypothetical protein n=1 Tax=Bacillus cereus TaxID=1396 RepID=UPI0022810695|nr:hypothetical protein [Bacillus cereus]